jgi:hypothetical protein
MAYETITVPTDVSRGFIAGSAAGRGKPGGEQIAHHPRHGPLAGTAPAVAVPNA